MRTYRQVKVGLKLEKAISGFNRIQYDPPACDIPNRYNEILNNNNNNKSKEFKSLTVANIF